MGLLPLAPEASASASSATSAVEIVSGRNRHYNPLRASKRARHRKQANSATTLMRANSSVQENAPWAANVIRVFVGHDLIAAQSDEPEHQNATDEDRTHILLAPAVECCPSHARHVPITNTNRLPQRPEQTKRLDSENTDGCGSQTESDQSNVSFVR